MEKQNYTFIVLDDYTDSVELIHLRAKDENEAWELFQNVRGSSQIGILLNEIKLRNLILVLDKIK